MTEYTVHNECDTYHVATIFQNGKEEEQDSHLRNETKNGANTADDTINYKAYNQVGSACRCQRIASPALNCANKCIIGPVCYECTHGSNGYIVNRPHNKNKDRNTK